jgi:type IV pilus assembly protein PilO
MAPPPAQRQTGFAQLSGGVKLGLLILMLGVLSAIYYFALHMSLAEEIDAAEQRYAQLQQDLVAAQQRQEEYLRLTQDLAARTEIDRQNKRVLPEDAEIPAFLQDLNRLAELSGLAIQLVEPRPEEQAEMYTRIPVSLRLSGQYHQLAKFFFNVSKLDRAVNMENVHLREPTVDADNVVLNINVLATTFRRPAEGTVPPGQQMIDQQQGGAQ